MASIAPAVYYSICVCGRMHCACTVGSNSPMVGIVVTMSPSFSLYSIVVLPAASNPVWRTRIVLIHVTMNSVLCVTSLLLLLLSIFVESMMYTAQKLHVTHHTSECGLLYSYRKTIRNGWITTLPSQFSTKILYRAPKLNA